MTIVENPFAGQESTSLRELKSSTLHKLWHSTSYARITDIYARITDHKLCTDQNVARIKNIAVGSVNAKGDFNGKENPKNEH